MLVDNMDNKYSRNSEEVVWLLNNIVFDRFKPIQIRKASV